MKFIESRNDFPVSSGVLYYPNHVFDTVLTAIPNGETMPVAANAEAQMREIFKQLDRELYSVGVDKTYIVSVKLHLKNLKRDLATVNKIYAEYFGEHRPNRGLYGVDLPPGVLIEAEFVASVPVYQ